MTFPTMSIRAACAVLLGMMCVTPEVLAKPRNSQKAVNVKTISFVNPATKKAIKNVSTAHRSRPVEIKTRGERGVLIKAITAPARGDFEVHFRLTAPSGRVYKSNARRFPYAFGKLTKSSELQPGNYSLTAFAVSKKTKRAANKTRPIQVDFSIKETKRPERPSAPNVPGDTTAGNGAGTNDAGKTPKNPESGDRGSDNRSSKVPTTPVPGLADWESQMVEYGRVHCQNLTNGSLNSEQKLASTYYDAQWVFFQIGDYTKDPTWYDCAQAAEAVYRDGYVLSSGGRIPGYWIFSHGPTEDFLRTGDTQSQAAAVSIAQNAAFARDTTQDHETVDDTMSRETAYAIMSYLNAEHVGQPHRARTEQLVADALGHLDQWFVSKTADYVRPFMFSLTAHALISYDADIGGNAEILPAIERGANWLWDNTWLPKQQAFQYTDRNHSSGGTEPAPDLNLLVAPVYAWLWHKTGNVEYRDRADQIFAGGVAGANLSNGKQFNQNYRWSFQYLKWRNGAPIR